MLTGKEKLVIIERADRYVGLPFLCLPVVKNADIWENIPKENAESTENEKI